MTNYGRPHDDEEVDNQDEGGLSPTTKQNIADSIPWMQATAFIGFGSVGLSVITMLRTGQYNIIGLAVSFIIALFLFQQTTALKKFIDGGNKADYNESLKHEANYWLVYLIIMGLALGLIVLGLIIVLIVGLAR